MCVCMWSNNTTQKKRYTFSYPNTPTPTPPPPPLPCTHTHTKSYYDNNSYASSIGTWATIVFLSPITPASSTIRHSLASLLLTDLLDSNSLTSNRHVPLLHYARFWKLITIPIIVEMHTTSHMGCSNGFPSKIPGHCILKSLQDLPISESV